MSVDSFPVKANEPEVVEHHILIQGDATVANASIVSGTGKGWSLGYSGTGLYTLTPKEKPGTLIGFDFGFQASTQLNVAGHSAVADDADASTFAVPVQVYNATPAAHALVANEYLSVKLRYKVTGANL